QGILRTESATSLQKTVRFEDGQAESMEASGSRLDQCRWAPWEQNGYARSSNPQWTHSEAFSESEEEVDQWTAGPATSGLGRWLYLVVCWLLVLDTWLLSRWVMTSRRRWLLALLLPLLLWACVRESGYQPIALSPSTSLLVPTRLLMGCLQAGSSAWAALAGLAGLLTALPRWTPKGQAEGPCLSDDRLDETVRAVLERHIHHLEDKWARQTQQAPQAHTQVTLEDLERLQRRLEDQAAMDRELWASERRACCGDALADALDARILARLHQVRSRSRSLPQVLGDPKVLVERGSLLEEGLALLGKQVADAREAAREAARLATLPRKEERLAATGDPNEAARIVREALRLYDADKTGQADYALESAGGTVVNTRCTETYSVGAIRYELLGFSLWTFVRTARTAIQPQVHPGECWAFRGSQGHLVVQLARRIRPTSFAVEHIPKELAVSGSLDSAPRDFLILGLASEADHVGKLLGSYTYDLDGPPLQRFAVEVMAQFECLQDPDPGSFLFVEMKILSNHGHLEYTCLYRLRVHGVPSD
ncbi:unnamed protein product, partial [Ixodes hexagonus]